MQDVRFFYIKIRRCPVQYGIEQRSQSVCTVLCIEINHQNFIIYAVSFLFQDIHCHILFELMSPHANVKGQLGPSLIVYAFISKNLPFSLPKHPLISPPASLHISPPAHLIISPPAHVLISPPASLLYFLPNLHSAHLFISKPAHLLISPPASLLISPVAHLPYC